MPSSSKKSDASAETNSEETIAEALKDQPADVHAEGSEASKDQPQPMEVDSVQVSESTQDLTAPGPSNTPTVETSAADKSNAGLSEPEEAWPGRFNAVLSTYFSETSLEALKKMYLEGPEAPFVSDDGWGGRQPKPDGAEGEASVETPVEEPAGRGKGHGRGGRGARGGRGGRGGGRGGRPERRVDNRKVLTDVCVILLPQNTCYAVQDMTV
jgi:tRNA pseudouridine13 synthase